MFATIFNKMHLNLSSIKIEKFRVAEQQLELLKSLFDYKQAQDIFVQSPLFYRPHLTGKAIQQETYLGRYFSYTSLSTETQGFKTQYFKGLAKQQPAGVARMTE